MTNTARVKAAGLVKPTAMSATLAIYRVWFAGVDAFDRTLRYEVWQVCADDALSVVYETRRGRYDVGCRFDWMCSCRRLVLGALKMRAASFATLSEAMTFADAMNEPHTDAVIAARRARQVVHLDLNRLRRAAVACWNNPDALPLSAPLIDGDMPF